MPVFEDVVNYAINLNNIDDLLSADTIIQEFGHALRPSVDFHQWETIPFTHRN